MPFRSQAQRAWMHIHHPGMASRWEKETPDRKLPKHVNDASDALRRSEDDDPTPSLWDIFGYQPGKDAGT